MPTRIVGVDISVVELPLRDPFKIAYGTWDRMPSIVCRLEADDGSFGLGEAVPDAIVTGETVEGTEATLVHVLAPAVLGEDPRDLERLMGVFDGLVHGVPTARAALEIAMNDLIGRAYGIPVFRMYGGRSRETLEMYFVVSMGAPDEMARSAHRAIVNRGFRGLKLKLGSGTPEVEEARVAAIRDAVGEVVPIRIDANQGWGTPSRAVAVIRRLERFGPLWIEQPVRAGDLGALAEVRGRVGVPIMADEAVRDASDLFTLIRLRAADMVNVKLMKCGGISQAARLIRMAGAAGLGVQIGSMVESGIGSMAAAHLATALPEVGSLEATGPLLFTRDVVESPITGPRFAPEEAPGLGVSLDADSLAALTVRHHRVTAKA